MLPEDILGQSPLVLSQSQREQYFAEGFLTIPNFVSDEWLDRLCILADRFVDAGAVSNLEDRTDCSGTVRRDRTS